MLMCCVCATLVCCVLCAVVSGDKQTTYFMCNAKALLRKDQTIEVVISINCRDHHRDFPIFDLANRGEDRYF